MIVICKKGTVKLVKELEYEAIALNNSDLNKTGMVYIKDIGWYSVNNFLTIDGKPLPNIDIKKPKSETKFEFSDLSKHDILICKSDNYKSLVKGGLYKIESLSSKTIQVKRYNGTTYPHVENYVKFEGISRKLLFNSWRFEKLPTDQVREMTLEKVLYNAPDKVNRTNFRNLRKIEHIDNKDKELMCILSKSILDNNRHGLDIVNWTSRQLGTKMDLEVADYDNLLKMKLVDILKLIENK